MRVASTDDLCESVIKSLGNVKNESVETTVIL